MKRKKYKEYCINSFGDPVYNEEGLGSSYLEWNKYRIFWWDKIWSQRWIFLNCRLSILFVVFVLPFVGTLLFYLRIICRIRQTYANIQGLAAQVGRHNIVLGGIFPAPGSPSQPAQRCGDGGDRVDVNDHLLGSHHCLLGPRLLLGVGCLHYYLGTLRTKSVK